MVKYAVPRSPDELEEFLNDHGRAEQAFETPAVAREFIEAYRGRANEHDPDLMAQQKEQNEAILKRLLEEAGVKANGNLKRPPMGGPIPTHRMAPGASLDGAFESLGEMLCLVDRQHIDRYGVDSRLKALGESQGDQGLFLVPEEYRVELLQRSLEGAIVRPRATVVPMARETLRIPAVRDVAHTTTVYGGIQAYWIPEAASATQTEPTFSQVRLDAKKLVASTRVNNELLADSAFALEGLLTTMFGAAIGYFEDDAFIAGIGAAQPQGIKNADCLVPVAKETGQSATTLVYENIAKAFSRMLPQSLSRAVWVAHMDTIPQLATLSLTIGTGGSAMWMQNAVSGLPNQLFGRPIVYTEKCETLGTAGDIYLADFSQYLIGDRMALEVVSSIHSRFLTDQTEFRFICRLDGRAWMDSAVTPRNSSNTLSPFVSIATRS